MRRRAWAALLLAGALGCGDGGADGDTDGGFCAEDWPRESWATFGQGFMTAYCRSCHGVEATDRQGAPVGVDFDTEDEALMWADRVLARVIEDADMPPAGGPPPETLLRLRIWLQCSPD